MARIDARDWWKNLPKGKAQAVSEVIQKVTNDPRSQAFLGWLYVRQEMALRKVSARQEALRTAALNAPEYQERLIGDLNVELSVRGLPRLLG